MPRASKLQTNFTAGELSDNVDARTNFQRYFNGSSILENFVIFPQGPIFKRKGFKFLAETKDSTKKSRIIEFEFSSLQTYAIEIGEGSLRLGIFSKKNFFAWVCSNRLAPQKVQ